VKELNVRIIDLETKSYASSSRTAPSSRRRDSRIEELTNQLHQTNKDKGDKGDSLKSSLQRSPGKSQPPEADRQRAKVEPYEVQIESMRKSMDAMVC
jgi:myosin heavy chain 9/10/11/14